MGKLTRYKFDELYRMSSGISSTPGQAGHGAPFLSFSAVFNNYFLPPELPDRMDASAAEQKKHSIEAGDIFLTRTSEVIDELGMSSVALHGYPGATYSGFLKRLRPLKPGLTYPKYMAFYLRSAIFRKAMTNNAVLTLRASLNEDIFSYLDLLLPSYGAQVSAGDLLCLFSEKIALNKKINSTLEAAAQAMFDYWFAQFDFPDSRGAPYKASGGRMVGCNELSRDIPEGWSSGTLDDLGQIAGGSTPSTADPANFTDDGTPWITPNDLSKNVGNKFIIRGAQDVTEQGFKNASLKRYPKGTVLLSSRAPIGYMAIAGTDLATNQGFKSFIPTKGYPSAFIYYAISRSLKAIVQHASGSTFKEVSASTLKTVKICLPDRAVAEGFARRVEPVFKRQELLEQENQQLLGLRDFLAPLLINGQVVAEQATPSWKNGRPSDLGKKPGSRRRDT